MGFIAEILFICFNIIMARHHANLIADGRPIKHGWWGLAYVSFTGLISFLYWQRTEVFAEGLLLFICSLVVRKVFFDLSLNIFRGKPLFYVSKTTTSIIDKIHYNLFKERCEIYYIVYFLASVFFAIYFMR